MGIPYLRNVKLIGQIDFGPTILLNDDFEGALSWVDDGDAGASHALDTSNMFRGIQCLNIQTANQAGATWAATLHNLLLRPLSLININASFKVYADSPTNWLWYLKFRRYDGTTQHNFQILFKASDMNWYYLDSDANEAIFSGFSILSLNAWHSIQLTIDLQNTKYVSVVIDNEIINLTDIAAYTTPSALGRVTHLTIGMYKDPTGGAEIVGAYIDDVNIIIE